PDRGYYLCRHQYVTLSRWISLPQATKPLKAKLPLRLLVILSNPPGTKQFNTEGALKALDQAIVSVPGLVVKNTMRDPSIGRVQEEITKGRYHAVHYIGHGGFEN